MKIVEADGYQVDTATLTRRTKRLTGLSALKGERRVQDRESCLIVTANPGPLTIATSFCVEPSEKRG